MRELIPASGSAWDRLACWHRGWREHKDSMSTVPKSSDSRNYCKRVKMKYEVKDVNIYKIENIL